MIFAGVCHTESDRMGIALGFVPQKSKKNSLQYLDNLIECGLPCFKENGDQEKDKPDSLDPAECCDCCEANNTLYIAQVFSTVECGDCVKNFIYKSSKVPEVIKCVEERNRQIKGSVIPAASLHTVYECFACFEDDAGKI